MNILNKKNKSIQKITNQHYKVYFFIGKNRNNLIKIKIRMVNKKIINKKNYNFF